MTATACPRCGGDTTSRIPSTACRCEQLDKHPGDHQDHAATDPPAHHWDGGTPPCQRCHGPRGVYPTRAGLMCAACTPQGLAHYGSNISITRYTPH